MSIRRRTSIAGLDFKKDYLNRSGQNNFGRRMSLATLGNGKYGRADDRNGTVVVRHIPIIIEGQEDEADEITSDKGNDGNASVRGTSVSVPISIVTVPIVPVRSTQDRRYGGQQRYDRSSTSSTESDNSVDISTSRRKNEDLTRKWQKLKSSSSNNNDSNLGNFHRTPLNDVTQKRHHTIASARKSSNPHYVVVKEMVGADQCPVHGYHHHCDSHSKEEQLQAPSLIRNTKLSTEDIGKNQEEKKKQTFSLQRGRPKHNNPATIPSLTPIKENVSLDLNKGNDFDRSTARYGSFRDTRNTKAESTDIDNNQRSLSQPFQRRWSMRIPSHTSHSSHNNATPKPNHRHHHRLSDHLKKDRFEGVGDDYKDGDDSDRVMANTKTDATAVSTLDFKPVQSSLHGKANEAEKVNNPVIISGQKSPCVGILKTPGKRKTSNNRVEFLDNLQEREIPSRHT